MSEVLNAAKTKLVDALISGEELQYSIENTKKAQQLALNLLGGTNTNEKKELLAYLLAHETVGYGPISILLEDSKNIEEIVVNSPTSNICVYHSIHGFCTTNLRFNSERDFRYMINKTIRAAEREINSNAPIIDAQLNDGSRVHAQLRPYSINGAAASIRLNGGKSMDLRRLMDLGTVTPELLAYLWLAIETNHNIIISGAPASGKTSFLLALNAFVPRYQRVITIEEDVNELKFYSNFMNSVSLQGSTVLGRASTRDQVINALHLRPDRLIVGEIRGSETNEMLSGSNYGVPFMTTMHSSGNGQAVVSRLQAKPMGVEPQILTMLDVSIFMRQEGLMSRKVESVVEYRWLSRDEISVEDLDAGSEMKMFELGKDGALNEDGIGRLEGRRRVHGDAPAQPSAVQEGAEEKSRIPEGHALLKGRRERSGIHSKLLGDQMKQLPRIVLRNFAILLLAAVHNLLCVRHEAGSACCIDRLCLCFGRLDLGAQAKTEEGARL